MAKCKTKLKKLKITELSQVDAGANQHADVILMKRDDTMQKAATKREQGEDFPAAAYAYVPDPQSPSTWKLRLWDSLDNKETAQQVGRALAAIGPGFRGQKVSIPSKDMAGVKRKILGAWRKTHESGAEVPSILKQEKSMDIEELTKRLEDMEAEVTTLKADKESLTTERDEALAKAGMSDAEKAYMNGMDQKKRPAFMAMSPEERKAMMEEKPMSKADENHQDEVSKRLDAIEKAHQEELAKRDETIAKMEKQLEMSELTKRVDTEYPNLPGESLKKALMLGEIEKMSEESQEMLKGIMKAHDEKLAEGTKEIGKSGDNGAATAGEKLEKMVKKHADEQSIDMAKAWDAVLRTEEGQKLYSESVQ